MVLLKVAISMKVTLDVALFPTRSLEVTVTVCAPNFSKKRSILELLATVCESNHIDEVAMPVSDPDTGIATSSIWFDSQTVANNSSIDLFFEKLGAHTVTVTSRDLVGNNATSSVTFIEIATFNSTISDVNRAYDLGWIKKINVRDKIIKDLERAKKSKKHKVEIIGLVAKLLIHKLNKSINQQAFDLLSEDIRWLLTH